MEYRVLGRSGLKVSPICLGAMMFGGRTDAATARRIVDKAFAAGVNFIDTADQYNDGRSEEIVGEAIRAHRHDWIVATKVASRMSDKPNERGLSRKWIHASVEGSLKRLGTDFIDIYYLHKEDHETPLETTVTAIADLIRAGRVRYFGVSNYRSWRLAAICALCDRLGIDRPVVSQPYYNAMNRMPETEHLPACRHFGLGVVPYSPLARGVLTGKYAPGAAPPAESRAGAQDKRMLESEWRRESLEMAQKIGAHAERRGMSAGQFALLWVLNNALVTAAIAGPRTEAQWDDYAGALVHRFAAEDEALIDSLVPAGHPSTPGYNDPAYPIEGRVPRAAAAPTDG